MSPTIPCFVSLSINPPGNNYALALTATFVSIAGRAVADQVGVAQLAGGTDPTALVKW